MTDRFNMTTIEKKKWISNQLEFLKPLILFMSLLYFPHIIGNLQSPDHVVTLTDFAPTAQMVTATVLYIVNAVYDLVRKWAKI